MGPTMRVPMRELHPTPIAMPAHYRSAILKVRNEFGTARPFSESNELALLMAHYSAPRHTITSAQLATQVGFCAAIVPVHSKLSRRATPIGGEPWPSATTVFRSRRMASTGGSNFRQGGSGLSGH